MTPLSIDGKKVQCPSCYEELKTGAYQRILKEWMATDEDIAKRDPFQLFSILTATDYAGYQKTPENEQAIWDATHWYVTQPFRFSIDLPKCIQIGEKIITVPRKVGRLSYGQNVNLWQLIRESVFIEENISMAIAIYLQPLYDEAKYDLERARELEKLIREIPVYLTHPIGFFLLQTVRHPGRKRTVGSRLIRNNLRQSLKRMLPTWLRPGGLRSLTTYH